MKATGIVRRIDDLGRVVIPKEIRRTQMIRVGDPLEIFVSANGEVVFKKYSPVGEMSPMAATCVETVYKVAGVPLVVTDRDHTVAAAGAGREALEKPLHTNYTHLMEQRRAWQAAQGPAQLCDGTRVQAAAMAPILANGDLVGSVALVCRGQAPGEEEIMLAKLAAALLGRELEG
ncbi:MAG: stage V sporulation T C-terminal domain-containing protein [Ruthenibacterium sp.]|jgi:hypothetical protein|nr:stage V sporulation protein T [Oscillospiraceae bacterium]